MEPAIEDASARLDTILHGRRRRKTAGLLSSVAIGQLLFASFAFGHSRGPTPLGLLEVLLGMAVALVFGIAFAALTLRRRLEDPAEEVIQVDEGRHRRRIAVFDDHFTVDEEVVLNSTIESTELIGDRLVLRYIDPRFSGPVLRELEAKPPVLKRLLGAIGRAPKPEASAPESDDPTDSSSSAPPSGSTPAEATRVG